MPGNLLLPPRSASPIGSLLLPGMRSVDRVGRWQADANWRSECWGTEGTLRTPEPSLVAFGLDQVHDPSLRLNIRLNVALGGAQGGMSREHLHVSERAAYR